MTVDIGFGCMAIDTSGVLNDFSRCTDFKSIVCQYPTPVASKKLHSKPQVIFQCNTSEHEMKQSLMQN
jgi:hypothetical protein